MLISRTPYRLSFYGGGLDYPHWYKRHGARVLCAGLDKYCYLTVRKLPPFFAHKFRACYSKIELTNTVDEIKHPAIREVLKKYGEGKNLEVTHVGDLPAKSGIGSSSAFTIGLISSLSAMNGQFLGRTRLAMEAVDIEQNVMNEKVGFQDQCASSFGGLVLIEADKQGIKPRKFISRPEYVKYITSSLLLGFDGIDRFSGVASAEVTKFIEKDNNFELMKELSQMSDRGIELFGEEADIKEHANLTKSIRNIKLIMNGDINNKRTNEIIEGTESAGSLCTRVMGAGGGGFFVCWAPQERHEKIKKSVNVKTWVNVDISNVGSQIIFSE